jgi:hypothetical protein
MPESILIIGHSVTYDEGGVVYGDPFVAHTTKGAFRTASSQEVANYQRLEQEVDGVITLPVSAGEYLEDTDYRLYRQDTGKTYEITGLGRQTQEHEAAIEVMVSEADPERRYEP